MRRHRLLRGSEAGSAPIEFVFCAVFACFLLFGVIEVTFALYGRNVVASSAHEAARAAVELGGTGQDAEAIARRTVARAAGNLVQGYEVNVASTRTDDRVVVQVKVTGHLDPPGPLPIRVPVDVTASTQREAAP